MRLAGQLAALALTAAVFAAFNLGMYQLLTRRLSNNFSDASRAQMVDVGQYLPFEDGSDLPEIDASLTLTGDLPVLDGAAALVPVYAAVIDSVYPQGCVTYEGGSFSSDNYYGENFAPDSVMQYNNTVRGYQAIVDGSTDILFCASPSQEQLDYALSMGVELKFVPIGLEGFVFFVNSQNPIENLSSSDIRKIYSCEYTNWSEVGGANRVINPVTRLQGSGSQTVFEAFMGDTKIGIKSPLAIAGGSIGFSFRYYMDGMVGNEGVKMISVDGVYPSSENIKNRSYPIITEFYAIYRSDNENENIPLLIDWLLSEEGQELIEKTGYVGIK
ncbi:MAG TPA: substrate-binding domain-containing protein [Candidatus Faeciplasma pullistercoris]|uniref:Substrate-binding domain-containing protein n=1 Tax=Candidatus Faeciplasma pullistercoris TaxID=2840800 RepID=A0A9D1KJ65_9FIRM|nr:substrate-binding domain-containing protein [Candidatus Faeciplasma pullistercoris]